RGRDCGERVCPERRLRRRVCAPSGGLAALLLVKPAAALPGHGRQEPAGVSLAASECLIAGQTIQEGCEPLDQIGGGLKDGQLAAAGIQG
ncbi:MAG: hypothetical protein VKO39_06815, partial [Cyanobacteriota bacterium]|nr:hypothetical protein [Cyanobacteriota bacterium]